MPLPSPTTIDASAYGLTLAEQLHLCRAQAHEACPPLSAPYPRFTLVFSLSDGLRRAHVVHSTGDDFSQTWDDGAQQLMARAKRQKIKNRWLRVDWVEQACAISWSELQVQLSQTQRNGFRLGLALDEEFRRVLTEQELNGNAMLYGGPQAVTAQFNAHNFEMYMWRRFAHEPAADFDPSRTVHLLQTRGVFCDANGEVHPLATGDAAIGRRAHVTLNRELTTELIDNTTRFLARQVQSSGQMVYGHFPCFDRRVSGYSPQRHASALYALLLSWEYSPHEDLLDAIEPATQYLCRTLIQERTLPDGTPVAFLVDASGEIKLSGSGACLLALTKYCELTQRKDLVPLLIRLAQGMRYMQDRKSGRFNHVLNAKDLTLKQATRALYYDGQATLGLLRLYALTRDSRWMQMVEQAFGHFIAGQYWELHDPWLTCSADELTRLRPREEYVRFGLQNVAGHLDFVRAQQHTLPNLLELLLAGRRLLRRADAHPRLNELAAQVELAQVEQLITQRAQHLLNGYFWPEVAMYFAKPNSVLGTFFVRQHSFRVRIDDVQQHLTALIDYHRYLTERAQPQASANVALQPELAPVCTASPGLAPSWLLGSGALGPQPPGVGALGY